MQRFDPLNLAMAQAVRGAIAQAGLTHELFCEGSAMSRTSLSRRLNGLLPFTFPELVVVAETTGVPLIELVTTAERIAERSAA